MTEEEKWLVQRFQQDDERAFDQLYEMMGDRVYRFALRLTGSKEDAEDIAVQTFLAAHQSRNRFEHRASFSTWLYRIALQIASKSRRIEQPKVVDFEAIDGRAEGRLKTVELEQMMLGLPPKTRTAFVLVRVEGLAYREVAQVMGCRTGTVQALVHQASVRLRADFGAALPVETRGLTEGS